MIKAYANVDGLSGALRRAGMSQAAENLPLFARGFSQADGLVDFVAVGSGKDRADKKILGQYLQLCWAFARTNSNSRSSGNFPEQSNLQAYCIWLLP
jgi:hypothetical protein